MADSAHRTSQSPPPALSDLAAGTRPTAGPATVGALLEETAAALRGVGFEDPRQEACDTIAGVLDVPRWWPAAHRADPASRELVGAARESTARRRRGMPLAYAVGRAAFRYLTLDVDDRVLIPRPETELLVDLVLARVRRGAVVDIGTGSGAIALALASEGDFDLVVGTDVSSDALTLARRNAARLPVALRARLQFRHGSFLAPVRDLRVQAVVSNPPYVSFAEAHLLPPSVRAWEPPAALLSGNDGLAATAAIVREAADILETGGLLAIEVDASRSAAAAGLVSADQRYERVDVRRDLTGRERFIVATRRTRS